MPGGDYVVTLVPQITAKVMPKKAARADNEPLLRDGSSPFFYDIAIVYPADLASL
jgi:hypothetical protein